MKLPTALHIGNLDRARVPALLPFAWDNAITIFSPVASTRDHAARLAEGLVLNLLTADAPGSVQVHFCEAQLSPQYPALKRLLSRTGKTYGQRAHDPRTFPAVLAQLFARAQQRSAQLAGNDLPDWRAYRQAVPRAGGHIVLLLTGLQHLQSYDSSIPQLQALCLEGPRVGIIPLIQHSPLDIAALPELPRHAIDRLWQSLQPTAHAFSWSTSQHLTSSHHPDHWQQFTVHRLRPCLAPDLLTAWSDALITTQETAVAVNTKQDFLRVPFGYDGGVEVSFCLGEASVAYHALIGGQSGMGKSSLLDTLILGACQRYTPEQIQFILIDLKNGPGFSAYPGLAHIHSYHGCFGFDPTLLVLLQQIDTERRRRTQLFQEEGRRLGRRIAKISDYNQHASQPIPYWLVVIDEVEALFRDTDASTAMKRKPAIDILRGIAQQSRSEGISLIFCAQSYSAVNAQFGPATIGQFALRISFHLATQMECTSLMGKENNAPLGIPPYTAVVNTSQGDPSGNQIIDVHHIADFDAELAAIKQRHPGQCQPLPGQEETTSPSALKDDTTNRYPELADFPT